MHTLRSDSPAFSFPNVWRVCADAPVLPKSGLQMNLLNGTLPPELAALTALTYLCVRHAAAAPILGSRTRAPLRAILFGPQRALR